MGNEKDEKQLERILKKLEDIKQFYSKIVSIYSISDDLVNIETNKDNALMEILTNHLNKNQGEINHLIEILNKEIKKIESIEKSISTIETFNNFMQSNTGDGTTTSRYKKLEAMLTNENITSLETKTKNIIQSYNQIYINNDPKQDLKVTELGCYIL